MIRKFLDAIFSREYEMQERIFRMIVLVGFSLAVLGMLECIVLMEINVILIPLAVLLTGMLVALVITFKFRNTNLAAVIVGGLIILFIFPAMFFLSGGLAGGAVLWFALGLFYVFLMFSGKRLLFFLVLALLTYAATYGAGYYFPELIVAMDSRAAAFADSIFSVSAVGVAGGVILKVQMRMFHIERSVARKQQEELEKISESKNSFFASMSHELRTPINTIIGLNEMILRESGETQTREYARNIQNASKMLLNLINDILDLSQMELKKMEIIPLEYRTADLFGDLVDMIQVRLQEKKLEFQVDIDSRLPSVLSGDLKRINQVILNILTNAAKYTDVGSVTLSAHAEMRDGEPDMVDLKISVADTGIGIRKEDLQYLYDSFKRADARKNLRVEGSGLGLSITRQLVDLMGGEISVDSIYRKGSVFTVILPQRVVDGTPVGNIRFLNRSRGGAVLYHQSFEAPDARVLIVDDNEMNALVACKLLEATKVKIDTAENGAACLDMTGRRYYHAILLDYMMPEMDGLQTLRAIRGQENGLCRESAVIALSAHTIAEAGRALLEEGFDGYLEKPVNGAALEAEILRFLPEDIVEYRQTPEDAQQETGIRRIAGRKKKKVAVTTDCISDLPENLTEKYDIGVVYLYVCTASGRFADTWEITSDDLNQYMTDTTSGITADGISVKEYEEFFADKLTGAEHVVHISVAAAVGSGYATAVMAAQGFDHVHVVDSAQISCGQGLVALYAGKLAKEGYDVEEILNRVERVKGRIATRFILPSADICCQRGYIGRTAGKVCGLLRLYPVLRIRQGKPAVTGWKMGDMEHAWKRFIRRRLYRRGKINTDIIFVSHAGCSVEQQELIRREVMRRIPFRKVIMQRASVSTACNTGIGTFGFAYYQNISEKDLR